MADQLLAGVVALLVAAEGDADRAIDPDLVVGQAERRRQCQTNTLGDMLRLRAVLVQTQEDAELVAADSRQRVACAQGALDPARDADQQLVARERSKAGVQAAEPVEIDDQHRVIGPLPCHRFDEIAEALTIGQPGEAVGGHLAVEAALAIAARGLVDQGDKAMVA